MWKVIWSIGSKKIFTLIWSTVNIMKFIVSVGLTVIILIKGYLVERWREIYIYIILFFAKFGESMLYLINDILILLFASFVEYFFKPFKLTESNHFKIIWLVSFGIVIWLIWVVKSSNCIYGLMGILPFKSAKLDHVYSYSSLSLKCT